MTVAFWTRSGTIDLDALRPQDLTAEAIADTLAKINRFGGRTTAPWPVAAHSLLVERLCPPELGPWALLHDAHEAFLGDLTDPAVEFIAQRAAVPAQIEAAVLAAKNKLDVAIGAAWRVQVRSMNQRLRFADHIALHAEAFVLMGIRPRPATAAETDWIEKAVGALVELERCGDWRSARDAWLSRVEHHTTLGWMSPPVDDDPSGMVQGG